VTKEAKRAQRKKLGNVENSMMKIDMLLNSPSSPVISALKQTQKYNDKELMDNLETYTDTMDDDIVGNLPDIKDINRDSRKLETLLYEVKKIKDIMVNTQKTMKSEKVNGAIYNMKAEYKNFTKKQNQQMSKDAQARMSDLYNEFLETRRSEKGYLTREQKLSLMRDTLTVDQGSGFSTQSVLPPFYAQDLVMFGVKRNYPEAVRFGEMFMVESG